MTHCRRCGAEMADLWAVAPLCPQCEGSNAGSCSQCGEPLIRKPELDRPFDEDTFGGEGVWEAYRCPNGHVEHEPID